MKKIIFSLLLAGLAGCASQNQVYMPQEFVDDALKAQADCARENVISVDDGISDAQTVALVLAQVCSHEYRRATNAFASANLDNERQRQMFRERRNTRSEKIDSFLPAVMRHRAAIR